MFLMAMQHFTFKPTGSAMNYRVRLKYQAIASVQRLRPCGEMKQVGPRGRIRDISRCLPHAHFHSSFFFNKCW